MCRQQVRSRTKSRWRHTHIVGQHIEWPIVTPSLLVQTVEEIVLGNEVTSARVKTACHDAGNEEIGQRIPSGVFDDKGVKRDLYENVRHDPACWSLVLDKARAESVKEDLESAIRSQRVH